jgi:hypothetical protein
MKALRHPALPAPIIPVPPCGLASPQHLEIPRIEILRRKLSKAIRLKMKHPNELLKTKGREKKDVKNEGCSQ